ncbi:MAG TPA: hypothetical protein VE978_21440 [Chitinophagales bacterium]|nr:hypothetical protein [Chitinophagales bacterium]
MDRPENIKELSANIWKNCRHRPTRTETQPFDEQLKRVDIKDFIVYNFLNHHGTALRELLLSTFQFWKDLNYQGWNYIFDKLRGNGLAEYYMAVIANQYLGIDPKYKSTRAVEIFYVTIADQKTQSGKPSLFVGDMQDELREMEQEELKESFGITIQNFVELSNRLKRDKMNIPMAKSFWSKLWRK